NRGSGPLPSIWFERDGSGPASRLAVIPIAFERIGPLERQSTLLAAAGLALFCAAGIVIGSFVRLAEDLPATGVQRAAGRLQLATALLWLAAAGAMAVFVSSVADIANIVYGWPNPSILAASGAALAATALTAVGAPLLPAVWRGPPRVERRGWPRWRKVRYTLAWLSFAALAAVLALRGALIPWHY
ncbi:MAG TPA: hypothetical protein VFV10_08480, partial [Gammaproteobacteria bacterium]|nr:hypothetical protein [Gammaproteobacteria bacterium]